MKYFYFFPFIFVVSFFLSAVQAQEIVTTSKKSNTNTQIRNPKAEPLPDAGPEIIINTEALFSGINESKTPETINKKILRIEKSIKSPEDMYSDEVLEKKRILKLNELKIKLQSDKRSLKK